MSLVIVAGVVVILPVVVVVVAVVVEEVAEPFEGIEVVVVRAANEVGIPKTTGCPTTLDTRKFG